MRAVADGELGVTRVFGEEMGYCLGCLACQSACPAGVDYVTMFEAARSAVVKDGVGMGLGARAWRAVMLRGVFMRPRVLGILGWLLRCYQRSGLEVGMRKYVFAWALPRKLRELEPTTPRMCEKFSHELIGAVEGSGGRARFRVGLLSGCVQSLAFSDVNRATADVLIENGCEVVTPPVQPCCGSLHAHNGEPELAAELARRMLDLFDLEKIDAIISNAGGCGSHLRRYGHLLGEDPEYRERAKAWDGKVRDIHEFLVEIGFRKPVGEAGVGGGEMRAVTYHESCHLCHGQGIRSAPREVLRSVPGVLLVEMREADWCCGSAGIYNITQPEQSGKLRARKVGNVLGTGAGAVATANPGCHLQLDVGLRGSGIEVVQPVVLLAEAYRAERAAEAGRN